MKFVVRADGQERTVFITSNGGFYDLEMDGKRLKVDCRRFGDSGHLSLLIENRSFLIETAPVKPDEGKYSAQVMGRHYDVQVLDELLVAAIEARQAREHAGTVAISAPMPGRIVETKVKPGDSVAQGSPVIIMEAMKMQNELSADVAGVVKEVRVANGQTVESQSVLVVIERE